MKSFKYPILFLLLLSFLTTSAQKRKKVKVTGHVTFTHIYKGGAKPTEEILQSCCQPKSWSNQKLYIKKNYYAKPTFMIPTDSAGNFKACLKEGTYAIYINNEVNPELEKAMSEGNGEDKKWLTEPYAVIEISRKGIRKLNLAFRERMNTEILPP